MLSQTAYGPIHLMGWPLIYPYDCHSTRTCIWQKKTAEDYRRAVDHCEDPFIVSDPEKRKRMSLFPINW